MAFLKSNYNIKFLWYTKLETITKLNYNIQEDAITMLKQNSLFH